MKEFIEHPQHIQEIYQSLNKYLLQNSERVRDDVRQFEQTAAQSHLRYAGMALLVTFYPFLISREHLRRIVETAESMIGLMEKITHLFLQEPVIQEQFEFSDEQVKMIRVDPGYKRAIPCARFDSFYDGSELKFSELNTDGSSGMDSADKIAKIYLSTSRIRDFFSKYPLRVFEVNRGVLDTLLECYREFSRGATTPRPRIAIVDWKEVRTIEEFYSLAEFFGQEGYEAIVADPRELEYDGKVLSHRGLRIDIVYRRVVSREYFQRLDEVKAMTRAFIDHNVCVVGSFRSDVAFSKKIFAIAQDPRFSSFFTPEERRLVASHIPWTHIYQDIECDLEGRRRSLPELARTNKERFVLKPSYLYEGRGVKVGALTDSDEWEELTVSALQNDYIIQERIPLPSMPIGIWDDEMRMERRWIHLGEFVFGGRVRGLYCRAADSLIIDRRSKEFLVPCLELEK